MNREEIISKGFYTYPQIRGYLSVKQYIVLREGNKKYLALRMVNEHGETATGVTLSVRQYDSASQFVATEKVEVSNIKAKTDASFNLKDKIALHEECERFEVDIVSMTFGSYKYLVRNGEIIPVFSLDEEKGDQDRAEVTYKMRKRSQKVVQRNRISPKVYIILSAIIFLTVCAFAVAQIMHFANTEVVFTLDDIEYSFETDNHKDGPIRIDKYKGMLGNVVIPDTIEGHKVARISANAFSGSWIGSVVIEGNPIIEERAFSNCRFLKSAVIAKSASIEDYAFYSCASLESVSLNSATVSIGTGAFEGCTSLKSVKLPDSLEKVEARAFLGCSSIETLVIPNSVQTIGEGAFAGCKRLKNLSIPFVGESAEAPKTLEHFFFDGEKVATPTNDLLNLTVGNSDKVLPEMFKDCKYLGSISFEKEVVEIGDRAFYGCTKLSSIDITDELLYLGESAFEKCSSLKGVTLSRNLLNIKARTFAKCYSLVDVEISDSLVTVGERAFEDCISLTVLKLPSTVTKISEAAFEGCTALTDLTVPFLGVEADAPSGINTWFLTPSNNLKKVTILRGKNIPEAAFKDYVGLETIQLPEIVTTIGKEAFMNCSSLKEFTVPMGVSVIEEMSFKGCVSLSKIKFSNKVAQIGSRAFEGCKSLSNIEMSDMLHTIEEYAFAGCSSLEELKLPANLSVLSKGTLSDCTALKSIALPAGLNRVEERAFANCVSLCEISLPSAVMYLENEAFLGCVSIKEFVVPQSVIAMGEKLFSGCTSLTSLTVPDLRKGEMEVVELCYFFDGKTEDGKALVPASLTTVELTNAEHIAPSAFANCENINKILLPVSLNTVGEFAFQNCKSLKNLTIPVYVRGIGHQAFAGCTSLEELSVPSVNMGTEEESGFKLWFGEIPPSLARVRITNSSQINRYAFSGCTDIREVIFDSAVSYISEYAFYNCTNLSTITLSQDLSVIGGSAFEGCYRLYEVINNSTLPVAEYEALAMSQWGVDTGISKYALCIYENGELPEKKTVGGFKFLKVPLYDEDNKLYDHKWYLVGYEGEDKHWILPDSETLDAYEIANYVFYRNETVESVFIPWNVDGFGVGMFAYCTNLKEVVWHQNTTASNIPASAFAYCSALERLDLPRSIKTVGAFAFEDCKSLMQVKLYESVNHIGENAFVGCTGMLEVVDNCALEIQRGQESFGGIARYALRVGTEGTLLTETIVDNGVTYHFARVSNEWYLYRIGLDDAQTEIIKLPELSKFDNVKYSVIKDSLCVDAEAYIIPVSVKRITDESLDTVRSELSTIYYMGSEDDWTKITDEGDAAVYYYAKCIHRDGQWNYGKDGTVVTTVVDSFNENGVCTICKANREN